MNSLPQSSLNQLFTEARTHSHFRSQAVSDETLKELYDLYKWAPTSANASPTRVWFIKGNEAKEMLLPCLMESNREKAKLAPVTAIVAYDLEFYDHLPKLYPQADARSWFAGNVSAIESTAFRNSSLQGAYLMLAARALGLDCGPMSGFDPALLDETFFKGTKLKSNFICNLGYGLPEKLHPRNPRLDFEEACKIL